MSPNIIGVRDHHRLVVYLCRGVGDDHFRSALSAFYTRESKVRGRRAKGELKNFLSTIKMKVFTVFISVDFFL